MIERRRQIQVLLQLVGDVVVSGLAVLVAYWLRFEVEIQPVTKGLPPLHMYLRLVPVVMVLYPVVFYFQGLYQRRRIRSRFDEALRVIVAVVLATILFRIQSTASFNSAMRYSSSSDLGFSGLVRLDWRYGFWCILIFALAGIITRIFYERVRE